MNDKKIIDLIRARDERVSPPLCLLCRAFRHSVQTGRLQYPAVDALSTIPSVFSINQSPSAFNRFSFSLIFYPDG